MQIGAQLYTVRDFTQTEKEFADAMKKIADIGYTSVQISAIGKIEAQAVRDICDSNGLSIVVTHTNPDRIMSDTQRVIEEHKIMGAGYVGIGSMPDACRITTEGVRGFIETFSPAAREIKEAGLRFTYHNHDFEFEKMDGKLIMDYLVDYFPDTSFTLDTYWVQAGGGDPSIWLEKLSGRVDVIHIKDMRIQGGKQVMAEIYEGNLNWNGIFGACERAGVKWAFVEQDDCYGMDPFQCLTTSFENLRKAGLC